MMRKNPFYCLILFVSLFVVSSCGIENIKIRNALTVGEVINNYSKYINEEIEISGYVQLSPLGWTQGGYTLIDDQGYQIYLTSSCEGKNRQLDVFGKNYYTAKGKVIPWVNFDHENSAYFDCTEPMIKI